MNIDSNTSQAAFFPSLLNASDRDGRTTKTASMACIFFAWFAHNRATTSIAWASNNSLPRSGSKDATTFFVDVLFDDAADLRALQALRLAEILLLVSRAVLNKFIRDVRSDVSEVASTGGALLQLQHPNASWSGRHRNHTEHLWNLDRSKPLAANFDGLDARRRRPPEHPPGPAPAPLDTRRPSVVMMHGK